MKRSKIKKKYLNQIKTQKTKNIYDLIEQKIIKSLITVGLLLLLICWGAIPIIILKILNINTETMTQTSKIIISFITDILLLIVLIGIYWKTMKKDFQNYFNKEWNQHLKTSISHWLIGFGIMLISNIIIIIVTNGQLSQNEEAVRDMIDISPIYMAFQLIIYAPLTEEIIFRKSIKDIFNNKKLYIITSGLIFGGLHVITSLNNPLGFLYLIPYCTLGFVFANLYQKKDNIFYSTVAHSIHNTLALIMYLRG